MAFPDKQQSCPEIAQGPWDLWKRWQGGLGWGHAKHELSLSLLNPFHMGLPPLQQPEGMGP